MLRLESSCERAPTVPYRTGVSTVVETVPHGTVWYSTANSRNEHNAHAHKPCVVGGRGQTLRRTSARWQWLGAEMKH